MSVIMPKIKGFKIMTPDLKTVISEHGPDELDHCRQLISDLNDKFVLPGKDRTPGPVLQYIFEELEEIVKTAIEALIKALFELS